MAEENKEEKKVEKPKKAGKVKEKPKQEEPKVEKKAEEPVKDASTLVEKPKEEAKEAVKEGEKAKKTAPALTEEKKEEKPAPVLAKKDEKVFTIPLRKAFRKSKNRRKNYAISLIKEFLLRHTKAEDVKLGTELNKFVWEKGKPPRRIRVKAVKEGTTTKAELMGFEYKEFKAISKTEKKGMKERLLGRLGPKALKKEEEEKMIKEKIKPEKPKKIEKHTMVEE